MSLDMQASACFHEDMKQGLKQPRRSQAPVAPKDRILDRAVELFAVHGFEAMTMRMLGEAAGLDNSSLYRHFSSKAELAHAVLDHVAGDFLKALGGRIDPREPPTLEALEALAGVAAGYFFERPAAARLMLHWVMSAGAGGPGFGVSVEATDENRPGGRFLTLFGAWLGQGARAGALRQHAMPEAVIILFGAILLRPATYGHLLASIEPKRSRVAAAQAWAQELRLSVRGMFAP
jgi:AcrR family transcriptional regulator